MLFNIGILIFFNQMVGKYPLFDKVMLTLANHHLFKMFPLILILWGFWFATNSKTQQDNVRYDILKGLFGSLLAMVVARIFARALPYAERPFRNPDLHLNLIPGLDPSFLDKMSTFPSDNSTLAFALATTIYLVHKRWGIAAFFYSFSFIALPRVYLAFHYPSDILFGAMIGFLSVWIAVRTKFFYRVTSYLFSLEHTRPAVFYMGFFGLCSQMAQMFDDVRTLLDMLAHFLNISPV
jgi:undecaprenyl-diphosphatase